MPRRSFIRGAGLYFSSIFVLLACASAGATGKAIPDSQMAHVKLSDFTLNFAFPALRPSKDFGEVLLVSEIDLAQVVKPKTVFHGYWDGSRYKMLSVTGTLRIWMDVLPWPDAALSAPGCDAKLKALVDLELDLDHGRYIRWKRAQAPTMESSRISMGGRDGLFFKSSYDEDQATYIFPVDGRFVLRIVFNSINNSGLGSEWGEVSAREQERFVRSLALSGDPADCQ